MSDSRKSFYKAVHNEGAALVPAHSVRDGKCSCRDVECRAPGKHPVSSGWQRATGLSAKAALKRLDHGDSVSLVPKGQLFIVDVDQAGIDRHDEFAHLIPETLTVRTQGGGLHYYLLAPEGEEPPPTQSGTTGLGTGVDVRSPATSSDGGQGQAIGPGSRGEKGEYVVEQDVPIAEAPAELLAALRRRPSTNGRVTAEEWLEPREPGERNSALARLVGSDIAKGADLDMARRNAHLVNRSWQEPLPEDEVDKVVDSIGRRESSKRELDAIPKHVRPVEQIQLGRDDPTFIWVLEDGSRLDVGDAPVLSTSAPLRKRLLIARGDPAMKSGLRKIDWDRIVNGLFAITTVKEGYDEVEETLSWLIDWLRPFHLRDYTTCEPGSHRKALREYGDTSNRDHAAHAVIGLDGVVWLRVEPFVGWLNNQNKVKATGVREMSARLAKAGFTKWGGNRRPHWNSRGGRTSYWVSEPGLLDDDQLDALREQDEKERARYKRDAAME